MQVYTKVFCGCLLLVVILYGIFPALTQSGAEQPSPHLQFRQHLADGMSSMTAMQLLAAINSHEFFPVANPQAARIQSCLSILSKFRLMLHTSGSFTAAEGSCLIRDVFEVANCDTAAVSDDPSGRLQVCLQRYIRLMVYDSPGASGDTPLWDVIQGLPNDFYFEDIFLLTFLFWSLQVVSPNIAPSHMFVAGVVLLQTVAHDPCGGSLVFLLYSGHQASSSNSNCTVNNGYAVVFCCLVVLSTLGIYLPWFVRNGLMMYTLHTKVLLVSVVFFWSFLYFKNVHDKIENPCPYVGWLLLYAPQTFWRLPYGIDRWLHCILLLRMCMFHLPYFFYRNQYWNCTIYVQHVANLICDEGLTFTGWIRVLGNIKFPSRLIYNDKVFCKETRDQYCALLLDQSKAPDTN